MFEQFLESLGLSDKESKVYLYLLKVDNDSVIDIANKTGINRTTVYPILDELSKKGLVSEVKVDKKVRYQAESPERLETFVQRRKLILEEQEKRLKDFIPQIKSLVRESSDKPMIRVYDSRDGVISALEDFYENADDKSFYSIYSKDLIDQIFTPEERQRFYKIRKDKKKMHSNAIYTKTGDPIPASEFSTRKRIDENEYPISCDITISGDDVIFSSLKNRVTSVFIKNKDIANTLKSLVNYILKDK